MRVRLSHHDLVFLAAVAIAIGLLFPVVWDDVFFPVVLAVAAGHLFFVNATAGWVVSGVCAVLMLRFLILYC